jgi:pimeloyl-ACP methyl ester carboxylesterase
VTDPVTDGDRSRYADLGGRTHYEYWGGPAEGPRMVLVHGLGGSHLNWSLCAPALAETAQVWTIDLPGFGRSEPLGRATTVQANVEVLIRFVREVVGAPAVLVGNSMGGMITILASAAAPDIVSGAVLVDPSLPLSGPAGLDPAVALRFLLAAIPGMGARSMAARRARIGSRAMSEQTLRLCGVDVDALPPGFLDRNVAMVDARRDVRGMDQAFVDAARSLVGVNARAWSYWAAMASIQVPVLLLQGGDDRLVPAAAGIAAAKRNPAWRFELWPGVGHVPQMQVPERFVALLRDWLTTDGAAAAA